MISFPKVSIIVPVFKVKKYIKRCVLSIINQSYKNIELLLIDDRDVENSIHEVLDILEESLLNYHIIKHLKNRGLSEARNTGIYSSTGDYLFFLDSDDELPDNAIKLLVEKAEENEAEIVMGSLSWIENKKRKNLINNNDYIVGNTKILEYIDTHPILLIGCNKMIKKSFIKDQNIYFHPNLLHEDLLYSFKLFSKVNSICFIDKITYLYYIREESITTQKFNVKKLESFIEIMKEMRSIINRNNNKGLFSLYKSRCFTMLEITFLSHNNRFMQILKENAFIDNGKNIMSSYTSIKDLLKTIPFYLPISLAKFYLILLKRIR